MIRSTQPVHLLLGGLLALSLVQLSAEAAVKYSGNVKGAQQAMPVLKKLYCGKNAPKGVACDIHSVRLIGDWAWFSWSLHEAGGDAIARKTGGSWKLISSGGGVMIVQNAIEAGVPRSVAEFLVPIWMLDSTGALDPAELQNLSAWELLVLRNGIYARHGRRFSHQRLQDYFLTLPWYRPNARYSDSLLSEQEKANVRTIMQVEKQKGYL